MQTLWHCYASCAAAVLQALANSACFLWWCLSRQFNIVKGKAEEGCHLLRRRDHTDSKAPVFVCDHKHCDVASKHFPMFVLLADDCAKALLAVKGQPAKVRPILQEKPAIASHQFMAYHVTCQGCQSDDDDSKLGETMKRWMRSYVSGWALSETVAKKNKQSHAMS